MSAAREKDQADFDLERFIDMFDEAMTSSDPRVIDTLRSLMMIVTLTRSETAIDHDRNRGPLRRLFDDVHNINRRLGRIEDDHRHARNNAVYNSWTENEKYTSKAAAQLAQSIDDDIVQQLSKNTAIAVNGGQWPKGKLTK